jgi:hypothetical protein
MIRIWTLTALGIAVACAGAAQAQQTSGATGASGATASGGGTAEMGAPASAETGVKGVYSTKRTMGISTGQSAPADAERKDEASAEAKADENSQPASN